jgi:hypothetical protein
MICLAVVRVGPEVVRSRAAAKELRRDFIFWLIPLGMQVHTSGKEKICLVSLTDNSLEGTYLYN